MGAYYRDMEGGQLNGYGMWPTKRKWKVANYTDMEGANYTDMEGGEQ